MNKFLVSIILLICTVLVFIQMRPTGNQLRTPQTQFGILDLEFAYNTTLTRKIIHAWQPDEKIHAAKTNTYLDFLFIVCYTAFLYYACSHVSIRFHQGWQQAGLWLSRAVLMAGILDILENTGMLITLGGMELNIIGLLTAICAGIKWIIVMIAVIFLLLWGTIAIYQAIAVKPTGRK